MSVDFIRQNPALASVFADQLKRLDQCLCPTCGKEVGEFRDDLSRKEFTISGMCQSCQDSMFGG